MITINVCEQINSPYCVANADIIHDTLTDLLHKKEHVTLSFKNYKLLTTAFFNMSVGMLYGSFEYDFVDEHVKCVDLSEDDSRMIPIWISRAKRYFEDPEYYDAIIEKSMEEW